MRVDAQLRSRPNDLGDIGAAVITLAGEQAAITNGIPLSMLPLEFPAFPGREEFNVHAILKPAREVGGDFYEAINEGVRQGYKEGYLRKSMVDDPIIDRKNTKDNTPALIYLDIVPGDKIKITLAAKGGGSENMSEVKMMKAADGIEGVIDFVVDRVKRSGGNPCPPIIVGVGLGGNFEQSALLAKKSLLRPLNEKNPDPKWAKVEDEILERVNNLGIGPQGLGGRTTAIAVNILHKACHIACMPVAVNIQCHVHRHKSTTI